jgi:putative membrane protein
MFAGHIGREAYLPEARTKQFQSTAVSARVPFTDMRTNTFLLGAACVALLVLPSQTSFAAKKKSSSGEAAFDASFIKKAANINMTEVQLGKIAQEKGQAADVKSFGDRMVKDHSKLNDQLKTVAQAVNAKMPEKINAKHKALIDELSKLNGADFDKSYAEKMVDGHKNAIKLFEKAQAKVTQPDLKKYIDEALPTLKEHLEFAKKVKGS